MSIKNKLENLLSEKISRLSPEEKNELTIDILALFEGEGFSLVDNGWLDSESDEFIEEVLNRS